MSYNKKDAIRFKEIKDRKLLSENSMEQKRSFPKKDMDFAILSFILSLFVWIPLFNFVIAPAAFIFGMIAVFRIRREPKKYGGMIFAIFGIVIGLIVFLFSLNYWFR